MWVEKIHLVRNSNMIRTKGDFDIYKMSKYNNWNHILDNSDIYLAYADDDVALIANKMALKKNLRN